MKKTHFFILLVFLISKEVFAQSGDEKFNLDRKPYRNTAVFIEKQKDNIGGTLFKLSYRNMTFLNPTYSSYVKNKDISYGWGGDIGLAYVGYPFMIDAGFMFSQFNVYDSYHISYYPDVSNKVTMFYGLYASFNFFPLPDMGVVTNLLQPYLGIGYQNSGLNVEKKKSESSSSSDSQGGTLASFGLSGMNWKIGVLLNLGRFALNGEYRQGLSMKYTNFSEWTAGIVVKMGN